MTDPVSDAVRAAAKRLFEKHNIKAPALSIGHLAGITGGATLGGIGGHYLASYIHKDPSALIRALYILGGAVAGGAAAHGIMDATGYIQRAKEQAQMDALQKAAPEEYKQLKELEQKAELSKAALKDPTTLQKTKLTLNNIKDAVIDKAIESTEHSAGTIGAGTLGLGTAVWEMGKTPGRISAVESRYPIVAVTQVPKVVPLPKHPTARQQQAFNAMQAAANKAQQQADIDIAKNRSNLRSRRAGKAGVYARGTGMTLLNTLLGYGIGEGARNVGNWLAENPESDLQKSIAKILAVGK